MANTSTRSPEARERDLSGKHAVATAVHIAVAYCRCSTNRQEASIPEQRHAITEWCARHGYAVVRFFEDQGISGSEFDRRPGFQAMLRYCREAPQPFDAVVVWDKSRLGRPANPKELIACEWEIERHGKHIVYVSTGRVGDGSTGSVFQDVAEGSEAGEKLKKLSQDISRH